MKKGYKKVVVIDDLSDYGKGVADALQTGLKKGGVDGPAHGVDAKTTDYGSTADPGRGLRCAGGVLRRLRRPGRAVGQGAAAAGFTGDKYTGNGGKSSVFTDGAGAAGDGWYFTCGCSDATVAPEAKDFTAAYKAKFNTDPSTYSPEAYDATNAMIEAIKTAAKDGTPTRESVEKAVNALDYKGITTEIKFDDER